MKVGFIGAGNMGGALAGAVSKISDAEILIFDKDTEKARALCEKTGAVPARDAGEVIMLCDFVFLGVKPNAAEALTDEIRPYLERKRDTVIISMLAGVSIEKITSLIGFSVPVIRIMPNTPVLVGSGMIAYSKNELISQKCEAEFRYMLKNAGTLDALLENLIDAETAVAGCGPAFVYMFIDALGKAGAECGLSPEKALLYAAATAKGAAEMILAGIDTPSELTRKVCSPGGSTIEGVKSLLESNLDAVVSKAVGASFKRTKELGK